MPAWLFQAEQTEIDMDERRADTAEQAASRLETALERIASRLAGPGRSSGGVPPEVVRRLDRLIDRLRTEVD